MKYVICPLYVMFVVTFFCRGNNDEENTKVLQYNDKTQLVRRIIGGPSLLFLSHSVFFRNDYPICVRSHLIEHSAAGYHHILAYFDRKRKKQEIKGPIVTRDTYMHVYERERDKMPLFVVNAYYTGTNITDSKISAHYTILFAKPMCFIVATQQVTVTSTGNRIDRRQELQRAYFGGQHLRQRSIDLHAEKHSRDTAQDITGTNLLTQEAFAGLLTIQCYPCQSQQK
nr:uncharacterized protein LOC119179846 [Rhipicephalus microplus]